MILTAFAKFLQSKKNEIVEKKSCTHLLLQWVKEILSRVPENNVEKVIHTEIAVATNPLGDVLLIAKSESGRKLMNALYNFALSYEHYLLNQWLLDKKASDFKSKKED